MVQGSRGDADYPAFYDAIGQAIVYLDLPWIHEDGERRFEGGAFASVYVVCARETCKIDDSERRILSTVPLGAIVALPNGEFVTIKDESRIENPVLRHALGRPGQDSH